MNNKTVVFIRHSKSDLEENSRFSSEFIEYYVKNTFNIEKSLRKVFKDVIIYNDPSNLISEIDHHKESIVLSEWKHNGDRNSKTLVPNICEKHKIAYVGSDAYTHILCQDKHLSKLLAKELGINTSNHIRVDSLGDITNENFLKLDYSNGVVIKPIFESESVGITENSIQYSVEEALTYSKSLFNKIEDSIIIENYISGDEINVAFMINENSELVVQQVLIHENQTSNPYLITYEDKRKIDNTGSMKRLVNILDSSTSAKLTKAFQTLGTPSYFRVDGRIQNGKFYLIEFTQSPGISENGVFHSAFKDHYESYSDFLKQLVLSALVKKIEIPN